MLFPTSCYQSFCHNLPQFVVVTQNTNVRNSSQTFSSTHQLTLLAIQANRDCLHFNKHSKKEAMFSWNRPCWVEFLDFNVSYINMIILGYIVSLRCCHIIVPIQPWLEFLKKHLQKLEFIFYVQGPDILCICFFQFLKMLSHSCLSQFHILCIPTWLYI